MLVTVESGKAVRVAGDPDHPFTRGFLCAKVNRYVERTYHPDRLQHPLVTGGNVLIKGATVVPSHGDPLPDTSILVRQGKIAAIGNDRDRDWRTLIEAFGHDARYDVKIATRRRIPASLRAPNVEIASASGIVKQRELYDGADVIVVPLRNNSHVSGLTVTLEAAALGKPMIVSTGGGTLDLKGDATNYNGQLNFNLTAVGKEVRLRYPPGVSSTATAELHWVGSR